MRRRRPPSLSAEDRAVWQRLTGTLDRVSGVARTDPITRPDAAPAAVSRQIVRDGTPAAPPASPKPLNQPTLPRSRAEPALRILRTPNDRPEPPAPGTPGLDRNTARRLARGQRRPDAVLDLHGMTADRAHAALNRFIHDSANAGLRCVLVVTGKGRSEDGGYRGDGLLRRETPRWLSVQPLASRVVGVFEAHPRHGGAGALYVYLKRQR